ncbi:MAG: hypothetical protein M4579_000502 [Chaenotheca gracillima]|nr:MAG: hypothetical protein M4579_000502 [Chaenotheca gracillima]
MSLPKWDSYHYGRSSSQASIGSNASHVRFSESTGHDETRPLNITPSSSSPQHGNGNENGQPEQDLHRRRSSLSMQIRNAGGLNSLDRFARSWQRASAFHEMSPHSSSYVLVREPEQDHGDFGRIDEERYTPTKSLLRQQFESHGSPSSAIEGDEERGRTGSGQGSSGPHEGPRGPRERISDLLSPSSRVPSPMPSTSYGTISSRISDPTMRHTDLPWGPHHPAEDEEEDKEQEPLLIKQVEREDGRISNVVVGQSTMPQTILNCGNTLIGVGILSLPLAVRHAGWLFGMIGLFSAAIVTSYTARVLAKCMDVDKAVITFGDLAYIAFGPRFRSFINPLFCLELLGANVALIMLFGDSLNTLIPGWGLVEWKIVCGVILIPMSFLPLRMLSLSSALGLICCFGIVAIVFIDGLINPTSPGSLWEPAKTHFFPSNWMALPLSFGLLMSPWGGHGVFPTIYRDMRHPHRYGTAVTVTYIFTLLMDLSMAVAGVLMFGDGVREEVTTNIILMSSYPKALSICMAVFIGIIPLTKAPLKYV